VFTYNNVAYGLFALLMMLMYEGNKLSLILKNVIKIVIYICA